MRKRRKPSHPREDLSDAKERAYAITIVAVFAVVAAYFSGKMGYAGLAFGVLITSAIALIVPFAGTEKQARPLIVLLRPFIWIVRILIDFMILLFSFLSL